MFFYRGYVYQCVKKTQDQIHYNMSRIRNKDTKIEVLLRKELWSRGLRYKKNVKTLEGKPDIVFAGSKIAIFCDSEFWHGYDWENRKNDIKTNRDFWIQKIERNMHRDSEVNEILEKQGWKVMRFWGKEIQKNVTQCADKIEKEIKTMNNKFRSIDLFAGIGGIRMGFDQAFGDDISTEFVCEWDQYAQKTYKANFHDNFEITGDITEVDEKDIPSFDICLAGFPCQAFSIAGKKQGFNDDYKGRCRGTLFFDVARICAYHHPKVIFCENVKGLTIHDKGNTFKVITETLEELGYNVYSEVLNSKNFGVPQNRERIYIVAFRKDIDSSTFGFPIGENSEKKIRDIMEEQPVSVKYYLSDVYLESLKKHKERHESKGNGFGFVIRDTDDIAGTIVCGGMGKERNLIIDKRLKDFTPVTHIKGNVNREGIRKMTPREWARLQGFPDSYELPLSDVHLYKQLGNSVSVPVIKAIASNIKSVLEGQPIKTPIAVSKRMEEYVREEQS